MKRRSHVPQFDIHFLTGKGALHPRRLSIKHDIAIIHNLGALCLKLHLSAFCPYSCDLFDASAANSGTSSALRPAHASPQKLAFVDLCLASTSTEAA